MNPSSSSPAVGVEHAWIRKAARWTLAVLFIYLGLVKAWQPVEFLKQVHQYDLAIGTVGLNLVAATVPWFEVYCGLLLVAGIAVRGTALVSLLMLAGFTLIVIARAWAMHALTGVPLYLVRFDCGCGSGEVVIWQKVIENGLLMVLAGWLLAGRR